MSAVNAPAYRRVILELSHAGADPRVLRAAAEFAHLMRLALHGVFIEDEALLALAQLPFAREIRLPTHEWSPLAAAALADELRHAADRARRALQAAVAAHDVPNAFEIVRGDPAQCIAGLCTAGDIVVVAQPAAGSAGALQPGRTARKLAASLLLLPSDVRVRHGPVAVLLHDAADRALPVAARLAQADAADLLILLTEGGETAAKAAAERAGLPGRRVHMRRLARRGADAAVAALHGERERIVVIGDAADRANAARIAAQRGVPVLLVAP